MEGVILLIYRIIMDVCLAENTRRMMRVANRNREVKVTADMTRFQQCNETRVTVKT